jgi:hypothetical protein
MVINILLINFSRKSFENMTKFYKEAFLIPNLRRTNSNGDDQSDRGPGTRIEVFFLTEVGTGPGSKFF